MEEAKASHEEGILFSVLAKNQLTETQVVSSLTETMMAAVDTVSKRVDRYRVGRCRYGK